MAIRLQQLLRFARSDNKRKALLMNVALELSRVQLMLHRRTLAEWLGSPLNDASSAAQPKSHQVQEIKALAGALATATRVVPWECKCLVQAIAAASLLRRKNIDGVIYIGFKRADSGHLAGHAWLKCGEETVCGGESAEFVVSSRYPVIQPRGKSTLVNYE